MIRFSVGKILFAVDFSFFAVTALLCLIENGYSILMALSVCFVHETGHIIAMVLLDERIKEVRFYGTGIRIVPYRNPLKPIFKDMLILLSGSAMNFLTALLVMKDIPIFAVMNAVIGIFNLLPYGCSDGGEAAVLLMEYFGNCFVRQNAYRILKIMGIISSAAISLLFFKCGIFNFTLALTLLYFTVF